MFNPKTLRSVFAGCLLLLGAGALRPAWAGANSFNDNKQVVCSTSTATKLSDSCPTCLRTTIINGNTDYLLLGDGASYSFSTSATTGTARITSGSYSPDGVFNPYTGAIYALCGGANSITVQVLRVK